MMDSTINNTISYISFLLAFRMPITTGVG